MDVIVEDRDIGMAAAAQADPHGDRPDIQVLISHHFYGFKYLFRTNKHDRISSDSVHEAEHIFMLHDDVHAQFRAYG